MPMFCDTCSLPSMICIRILMWLALMVPLRFLAPRRVCTDLYSRSSMLILHPLGASGHRGVLLDRNACLHPRCFLHLCFRTRTVALAVLPVHATVLHLPCLWGIVHTFLHRVPAAAFLCRTIMIFMVFGPVFQRGCFSTPCRSVGRCFVLSRGFYTRTM